ncbi:MAG: nuclear transport factor 2 family protein [Chloroflexota bacterium]|nr:nuclear transport factor 2 family protein [Chloroflexota bacterium]
MWSHRDDVSLLNPIVPIAHGWQQVARGLESAASQVRDGEVTSVENKVTYVTPELGFIVDFERTRAKFGARQDIAASELRVTTIFRPEDGEWKVVHRHADPLTTSRSIETVVQG